LGRRTSGGRGPAGSDCLRLLAWMDDDPYGFCRRLVQDVAEALDQPGRAALITAVRMRFEASLPAAAVDGPLQAVPYHGVEEHRYSRWR